MAAATVVSASRIKVVGLLFVSEVGRTFMFVRDFFEERGSTLFVCISVLFEYFSLTIVFFLFFSVVCQYMYIYFEIGI